MILLRGIPGAISGGWVMGPFQHIGCMAEPQHRELLSLLNEQLTELLDGFAQPPYRLRQLLDGLYHQRWSSLNERPGTSLTD